MNSLEYGAHIFQESVSRRGWPSQSWGLLSRSLQHWYQLVLISSLGRLGWSWPYLPLRIIRLASQIFLNGHGWFRWVLWLSRKPSRYCVGASTIQFSPCYVKSNFCMTASLQWLYILYCRPHSSSDGPMSTIRVGTLLHINGLIDRLMQCHIDLLVMWMRERARWEKDLIATQNNHLIG